MTTPTVGSLFSGAGGFDIGFHDAGFRILWQVEIDKTARSVLAYHWPDIPQYTDVRSCGAHNLAPVDILIGGFPCQDLSVAGARAGLEGDRSGLWWEMLRIISEVKPKYVVFENVPGLLSHATTEDDHGRCLCGWNSGRGRVPDGGHQQEETNLRCESPDRHDGESHRGSSGRSEQVRRDASPESSEDRQVGCVVDVGRCREVGDSTSGMRNAAHDPQGRSGEVASGTGADEAGRSELVDGRDAETGCGDPPDGYGDEPEGTASGESGTAVSDRDVCPGCGRVLDESQVPGPVRRYAMGTVVGSLRRNGYVGAWRVLDARWFGVPQSRRRVFGVFTRVSGVDSGEGRCAEILALAAGVRRHPAPGGKAGAGATAVPASGPRSTGEEVASSLQGGGRRGHRVDAEGAAGGHLVVFGGDSGGERSGNASLAAKAQRQDFATENLIVFNSKDDGGGSSDVSPTLRALPHDKSHANAGGQLAVLFNVQAQYSEGNGPHAAEAAVTKCLDGKGLNPDCQQGGSVVCVTGEVTHTLTHEGHDASEDGTGRGTPIVAFDTYNQSVSAITHTLRDPNGTFGDALPAVHNGVSIRRLTPVECERLMGWPDGWTLHRADGSTIPDGPRYKLCGNGVVGTISKWLALRMMVVFQRENT